MVSKKFWFGTLVLVLVLVFGMLGISCTGKADPESDFIARPIDGGSAVMIERYIGEKFDVRIPSRIQNLPVTHIGAEAFLDSKLISVVIPNSVIEIGYRAFSENELTSVTIPNSVIEIGYRAFSENELTSVTIPNSVTILNGFSENKLTSVTIPNSVTILNGFSENELTSVIIPNSVTILNGFSENELTSVIIPNSVTSIGVFAFKDDSFQLTSVTIGENVELEMFMDGSRNFIRGEILRGYYAFGNDYGSDNRKQKIFDTFYNSQGRIAGTYIFQDGNWTRQ